MTRNVHNNIRNEFNVPKSVKLDVSQLHDTVYNKKIVVHNGWRRPYLIWPSRNSWRGGKQAPR